MDQVYRINTIKKNKTITDRVTKKYLIEKNIEFFMAVSQFTLQQSNVE